jgi:uncharacterized membrane protein
VPSVRPRVRSPCLDPGASDLPESIGREHHNRWLTLALPAAVSLGVWASCWVVAGTRVAWEVLTAAGASAVVFGTTTVFGAAVVPGLTLDTWHIAAVVAYMGALLSFVYAYNLDLLERLPRVGDYVRRARVGAEQSLAAHPWIRRFATAGVALFVLTPLPGSGALGGSVVGRLVGLGPLRTFLATAIASIAVCAIYAAAGAPLARWLDAAKVGIVGRLVAVAGLLAVVYLMYRLVRRFAAKVPPETGA